MILRISRIWQKIAKSRNFTLQRYLKVLVGSGWPICGQCILASKNKWRLIQEPCLNPMPSMKNIKWPSTHQTRVIFFNTIMAYDTIHIQLLYSTVNSTPHTIMAKEKMATEYVKCIEMMDICSLAIFLEKHLLKKQCPIHLFLKTDIDLGSNFPCKNVNV